MEKLKGIIVPMVTPLDEQRKIDYEGTERLVNHLIDGGVHAIFVLGTTGEAQSLSMDDRKKLVEFTGSKIAGRVPYLVCVTDTSIEDSVALAEVAKNSGACAVVAAPPYYFDPSQSDMIDWYTALADRSPLPVYLYNMPGKVKVNIAPSTVAALASHPNIIGLKDSSANTVYFQTLLYLTRNEENFALYVGPEEITAETVLLGGDGGVNGGANMFPELYVKMYEAAERRDIDECRRLQEYIMQISVSIYGVTCSPSSYLQGLKAALELLGICKGGLALPYTAYNDECKAKVKAALDKLNPNDWN